MSSRKKPTIEEAKNIGSQIGVNWDNVQFTPEDLVRGMCVEYEHGTENPMTNVTNDDPIATAKIALAHLYEKKDDGQTQYDYYDGLKIMEDAPSGYFRGVSENYWMNKKIGKYVILTLIVIALICIFIAIQSDSYSTSALLGFSIFALFACSYLLYTWK